MCLAVPMQVVRIDGSIARCAAMGVERDASLLLLQGEPVAVDDFVLVHLGYALNKVEAEDARLALALFDEVLAAEAAG